MPIPQQNNSYTYDYYSGANIGIYLKDQLLTTVVGLQFNHMQARTPVYGYASSLYDGVADGHVIVEGQLFTNFIQSQLLSAYINNAITGKTVDTIRANTGTLNPDEAGNINFANYTTEEIDTLKQQIWGQQSSGSRSWSDINIPAIEGTDILSHARPDQHLTGFDIEVWYGNRFKRTEFTNTTVRVIRDVRITGFGQSITVDGEPIIESYSFIARSVT